MKKTIMRACLLMACLTMLMVMLVGCKPNIVKPTPTPVPTPTPAATATPVPTPTPEPTPTPTPVAVFYTVNAASAQLRETASDSGKVLAKMSKNEQVEFVEASGDWAKVKYKTFEGYVKSTTLTLINNETVPAGETWYYKTKGSGGVRMRSDMSTSSTVITTVKEGEQVELVKMMGLWYEVKYMGKTGYISRDYLTKVTPYTPPANYTVNGTGIRLRAYPTTEAASLATLPANAQIQHLAVEGNWVKVTYSTHTGYLRSDLLKAIN